MAGLFPVLLDVADRLCVVIGGGEVALRKARTLRERGARVRLISPDLCPALRELAQANEIEWEPRPYQKGDLAGAFLCAACAGEAAVNRAARDEARQNGILANVADDPQGSDYQVPSFFEDGPLLIALSTDGQSPAVARTLRRMIQSYLGPDMGRAVAEIGRFRDDVVKPGIASAKDRGRFWEEALGPEVMELAREGDLAGMIAALEAALEKFKAPK